MRDDDDWLDEAAATLSRQYGAYRDGLVREGWDEDEADRVSRQAYRDHMSVHRRHAAGDEDAEMYELG